MLYGVTRGLRLLPDYGEGSPVCPEDEWDEEGKRLASRLAAETGQPVEYMP
jgi:hypothetical protein